MESENGQSAAVAACRRGLAQLRADRFAEAATSFEEALALEPDHATATHFLGVALMRLERFEEAVERMRRSLVLKPNVPEFSHNLGAALRALGRFDEAEAAYRRALERKPDYAEAWFNYSAVKRFHGTAGEEALAAIEALLAKGEPTTLDRDFLHFAAGKIADDLGSFETAFSHYREGNRLRGLVFDRAKHREMIERLESVFSGEHLETLLARETGSESEEPVFIVGMPRSGTTLVEQMLASHPRVEGAGELPDVRAIAGTLPRYAGGGPYPEAVPDLPESAFLGFAEHYLGLRQGLRTPETRRIIDKMPGNFLHVGLIRLLFPRARVVHLVRDARDTCLSCYFHRFRSGHEYASDLDDLAFYHVAQERLMAHWKTVLPGFVHTLRYEDLVENPEARLRGLLDFCGLDWDDACLRFHESRRAVTTASNLQVRSPLNRRGLARWKRYESHLGPLFQALEKYDQ